MAPKENLPYTKWTLDELVEACEEKDARIKHFDIEVEELQKQIDDLSAQVEKDWQALVASSVVEELDNEGEEN